jgi:hypothetical protein
MSVLNHYAFVCDIGIASRKCLIVKKMKAEMTVKKMTAMIELFTKMIFIFMNLMLCKWMMFVYI